MRCGPLLVLVLVWSLAAPASLASSAPADPSGAGVPGAAGRAYRTMQSGFAGRAGLWSDAGSAYADAWPYSQALAATEALARAYGRGYRGALVSALQGLERYRDGTAYASAVTQPLGAGGTRFYDDNEWIGLDLVEAYRQLGDPALLERARQLFDFVAAGWDANAGDPCAGGVFWADSASIRDRNTVSTANGALLALELYRETGDGRYVAWAQRMYEWVRGCLSGGDGLLLDHLDGGGRIDRATWSYNQGAMIAAATLLAEATGRASYLAEATALADASLRHLAATGYAGEPPIFVAIFFRDLRLLEQERPSPAFRHALADYVAAHPPNAVGGTLLDRAAAVQLLVQLDA